MSPRAPFLDHCFFSLYRNDIIKSTDSELRLFADDCVCYHEIKNSEDTLKVQEDIPAGQMQYNADYNKTDQEDQGFLYFRGNGPR